MAKKSFEKVVSLNKKSLEKVVGLNKKSLEKVVGSIKKSFEKVDRMSKIWHDDWRWRSYSPPNAGSDDVTQEN